MSAEIIEFPEWAADPAPGLQVVGPDQKVFHLGIHSYTCGPGTTWVTDYWLKRIDGGRNWELYCTTEDMGSKRQLMNTFDPDEIREYFDDVHFELTDDEWHEMGWFLSEPDNYDEDYDGGQDGESH